MIFSSWRLVKRLRVVGIGFGNMSVFPAVKLRLCYESLMLSGNRRSVCSHIISLKHAHGAHMKDGRGTSAPRTVIQILDIEMTPARI